MSRPFSLPSTRACAKGGPSGAFQVGLLIMQRAEWGKKWRVVF